MCSRNWCKPLPPVPQCLETLTLTILPTALPATGVATAVTITATTGSLPAGTTLVSNEPSFVTIANVVGTGPTLTALVTVAAGATSPITFTVRTPSGCIGTVTATIAA